MSIYSTNRLIDAQQNDLEAYHWEVDFDCIFADVLYRWRLGDCWCEVFNRPDAFPVIKLTTASKDWRKQAVGGRPPRYAPARVRRTLRPSSSPYTPYAWPAASSAPCFQYLWAPWIFTTFATDVVRQTSDVRQHNCLMPPPRGRGIITHITSHNFADSLAKSWQISIKTFAVP